MQPPMRDFVGTMHLPGDTAGGVPFRAVVTDGKLRIEVAGTEVGEWELSAIRAEPSSDWVCLEVGNERVNLVLAGRDAFLDAVEGRSVAVDVPPPPSKRREAARRRRRRAIAWAAVTVASVSALVAASVAAAALVGSALMLGGIALLAGGAFALIDVRLALRLPAALRPGHLLALGFAVLALGAVVTALA